MSRRCGCPTTGWNWLPRADCTSAVYRHIMWFSGPVSMRDIGPAQVRERITALTAQGVSPP